MTQSTTNPGDDRFVNVGLVMIAVMTFTMMFVAFGYRGLQLSVGIAVGIIGVMLLFTFYLPILWGCV